MSTFPLLCRIERRVTNRSDAARDLVSKNDEANVTFVCRRLFTGAPVEGLYVQSLLFSGRKPPFEGENVGPCDPDLLAVLNHAELELASVKPERCGTNDEIWNLESSVD